MPYRKRIQKLVLVIAISLCTGCGGGGEPSERDMRDALSRLVQEAAESVSAIGASNLVDDTKVLSVKKLSCVESGNQPGYNCDVEVEMELGSIGKQTAKESYRFLYSEDQGWLASR